MSIFYQILHLCPEMHTMADLAKNLQSAGKNLISVLSPRVVGLGIPGEFDCISFPWVGNNERFDVMQDLEGGGVWQDLASAWKLASAYHLENITQSCSGLLFCACVPFWKLLRVLMFSLPIHC